jgi:hypothetical protein
MAEILIAALSPVGHIGPLLTVAQGLVTVETASRCCRAPVAPIRYER